jgi:hypothetical protein
MNTIPITDADGGQPLSIFRGHREWLIGRYKLDSMIALKYYSEDIPVSENDTLTDEKSIGHVRKCPKCREWIHHVIPTSVMQRQHRLTRYCCAGMFVAVEESKKKENRIDFEMFRGEDPCWRIDGVRSFISYCPWCGKKLPDKPFLER